MLSKQYRLPANLIPHFSGIKLRGRYLTLIYQPSPLNHDRLALIISKKVLPLAHDRHALKRHLHQLLQVYVDRPLHFDLLLITHARPGAFDPNSYVTDLTPLISRLKSPAKPDPALPDKI